MRFAEASNHALARAGTDNRARPLIELAWEDWQAFVKDAEHYFRTVGMRSASIKLPEVGEAEMYGCIIRPKADTIPPSVAFGAALSAMPELSRKAGCYTGIHVTALTGIDPRRKP